MNTNDNEEIERRKREFFGTADDFQRDESHFPPNRNYRAEPMKKCPFCRARIGVNAIFCAHCSRQFDAPEFAGDDSVSDSTWGENEATFHHLGGQYSSYDDLVAGNSQQAEKSYRCPACRSEQIQSFQMAYHAGTSQNTFHGSGYSFEAGSVSVSGTSHNQTYLADLTSPPSRPRPFLLAIIATFVIPFFSTMPLLMAYLTSPLKFKMILLIDFVLIAAVYALCGIFAPAQWKKYRQRYAEWEQAWICLRCGNSFYL